MSRPSGYRSLRSLRATALVVLLVAFGPPREASGAVTAASELSKASVLIESSRPEEALALLNKRIERHPKDPRALLLRSTAHFMLGNMADGKRDLDRSIEFDPGNRQAWLNLAALELADENYPSALETFGRAEALDPSAADNSLNIGAVLLLLDRFDEARDRFKDYLARNPGDPQARYLVASNYAMRGFAQPAVANLKRAIALDEKARRQARTDPNFAPLGESPEYQRLLSTDAFRHAHGSMVIQQSYDTPYLGGQSRVLDAVIGSLQLTGRSFDPQVEVTLGWALIWSDLRIKVSDDGAGGTHLEMSAPPGRFSASQWQALTDELFRSIKVQLHTRSRRDTGL